MEKRLNPVLLRNIETNLEKYRASVALAIVGFAEALTASWPQTNADQNKVHYLIGGSLGIDLIALSTSCVDNEGRNFPAWAKDELQEMVRPIKDVDIVPLEWPYPQTLLIKEAEQEKFRRLSGSSNFSIDVVSNGESQGLTHRATVNGREYLTGRFDVITATKLLSCLVTHTSKPHTISTEVPRQFKIALRIYGDRHIWQLVQHSFQAELNLGITEPRWMTVSYQAARLLESPDISSDLKTLVRKALSTVALDIRE